MGFRCTLRAGGHGSVKDGCIGSHIVCSHSVEELESKLPLATLFSCADEAGVRDSIAPVALTDLHSRHSSMLK